MLEKKLRSIFGNKIQVMLFFHHHTSIMIIQFTRKHGRTPTRAARKGVDALYKEVLNMKTQTNKGTMAKGE